MSDVRWERVKQIVDEALDLDPRERAGYVDRTCGADSALRREVESLLAEEEPSFMETSVSGGDPVDEITKGESVAHYTIVDEIARGGMGIVYRAQDTKLDRLVAIKALPGGFDRDAHRLARFEREARLLAQLNHPNIATVHGLEEHEGRRFLVMELVEGETLAERIARGPIRPDEAIALFSLIAEGLGAAHDKGIVHRDLKPANVMLTPEGGVKLLDFGLAKDELISGVSSHTQATSLRSTQAGMILGTAAYMSPEQARGQKVDKRTDVWSFGCSLYEALTGTTPFMGSTISDTIAAILEREPDWIKLPKDTQAAVRTVLLRCLQKDLKRRLRDIWDVRLELQDYTESAPSLDTPAPVPSDRPGFRLNSWWLAALAASFAGIALWALLRTNPRSDGLVSRSTVTISGNESYYLATTAPSIAISPDGRYIAYVAQSEGVRRLYLRPTDELDAREVIGSENALCPFFSPDGEWLGFGGAGGRVMKAPVNGGPPAVITELRATLRGASWGEDGWIVFTDGAGAGLTRVRADGGEQEVLTVPDRQRREKSHRLPEVLPGGRGVLFTLGAGDQTSWDDAAIAVYSSETQEHRVLVEGGMDASYAASGHVIFARDGSLYALPFDLDTLESRGAPMPVVEGVATSLLHGQAEFTLSRNGVLLYASGGSWAENSRGAWIDRFGNAEPVLEELRAYQEVRISPGGDQLALTIEGGATSSIWIYDIPRTTLTRVAHVFDHYTPEWSPEGDRLVFTSNRAGSAFNLFMTPTDRVGAQPRLTESDHDQDASSWSPDGRILAFAENTDDAGWDIWLLYVDSDRAPVPFLATRFNERGPRFSPNGRWIAYESDETGRSEVYVRAYGESSEKWQVSSGGGTEARWSANGRELFYLDEPFPFNSVAGLATRPSGVASVWVAPWEDGEAPSPGNPRELFELNPGYLDYDVTPDGQRFVVLEEIELEPPNQLILVQNWLRELEQANE